jgi:hypothetical protein
MFYEHNDFPIEVGRVYFAHMILIDSDSETAMASAAPI